ncbi:DUF3037 domain-containing protein [Pseudorhodoferax sp.]|uniref:DUF3037 domain-containing protein n=1 Tax=Pseudorhodoferax sp. TaxID=1993553 RepID=UPI002DD620C8|nr:DUF3037 domain-containing protein [Pseudorhodoferax sp.]
MNTPPAETAPPVATYDYAVLRVVPRVDRGEFINAGVIVCCAAQGYLKAGIALDEARLQALCPTADLPALQAALAAVPAVCAGGEAAGALGRLSLRERFDWLVAPRSASVQTSPVHSGRCGGALDLTLAHLMRRLVICLK